MILLTADIFIYGKLVVSTVNGFICSTNIDQC